MSCFDEITTPERPDPIDERYLRRNGSNRMQGTLWINGPAGIRVDGDEQTQIKQLVAGTLSVLLGNAERWRWHSLGVDLVNRDGKRATLTQANTADRSYRMPDFSGELVAVDVDGTPPAVGDRVTWDGTRWVSMAGGGTDDGYLAWVGMVF